MGRASRCHLQKIKTLQNRFLRASLFLEGRCPLNVMYSEFGVLKLEDMLAMEYAKFLHRFSHKMLTDYFKNYLDDLGTVHQHSTRKKAKKKNFFHTYARTEWIKKKLQRAALEIWEKLPLEQKNYSYFKFKNMYKQYIC